MQGVTLVRIFFFFFENPDFCSAKNLCVLIISNEFFLTSPISYTGYDSGRPLLSNMLSSGTILNLPDLPGEWDREVLWFLDCVVQFIYSSFLFWIGFEWPERETLPLKGPNLLLPGSNSSIHPLRELVDKVFIFSRPTAFFPFEGLRICLVVLLWVLIFIP